MAVFGGMFGGEAASVPESAAGVCCAAFQNAAQIGRSPLYASSSIRSVFGSRLNR